MNGLTAAQYQFDRYLPEDSRSDLEIESDAENAAQARREAASPVMQAHLKQAAERYVQQVARIIAARSAAKQSSVQSAGR